MRGPEGKTRPTRSWVDLLTDEIDRLPGPTWLAYLVAFAVLLLLANSAGWLDGYLPLGSFDVYLSSLAAFGVSGLAAIHYLDRETEIAVDRLRPALSVNDEAFLELRRRLTELPAGPTIFWTLVGLAIAVAYATDSSIRLRGQASVTVDIAIALVGSPLLAVLFYHAVRQLWLISHIQTQLASIDLFQRESLVAFSGVTARTGLIILALAYLLAAPEPSPLQNPSLIVFVGLSVLLAVAAFVLPMYGMHRRIAAEKSRLATLANQDLKVALARLSAGAQAGDLTDAEGLNQHLSSLIIQRDVIAAIPTWPWEPDTLRAFSTAVVLPIALWLIFRVFEQVFA